MKKKCNTGINKSEWNPKDNTIRSVKITNPIDRILEETGATHVKHIFFNKAKLVWVVQYKTDLPSDEFEFFNELYAYLNE